MARCRERLASCETGCAVIVRTLAEGDRLSPSPNEPHSESNPQRASSELRLQRTAGWTIFALFLGAAVFTIAWLELSPSPRRPTGFVYVATTAAGPRVLLLTGQERASWRRGRARTERYELQTHDGRTGAMLRRVHVADLTDTVASARTEVLGVAGERIWLWHGRLEGRDCDSLAVVTTAEDIRKANPSIALGAERSFFGVTSRPVRSEDSGSGAPAGLIVKSLDARYYFIDPRTLRADEIAAEQIPQEGPWPISIDAWFKSASKLPHGRANRQLASSGHGLDMAILGERILLIASEAERAGLTEAFDHSHEVSGDVRRRLYSGPMGRDADGRTTIVLASLSPMSEREYLLGGLLLDPNDQQAYFDAWTLDGTAIVLWKDVLGKDGVRHATRVRLDGTEVWSAKLGIAEPDSVADAGANLVFAGYPSMREPLANRPFVIVFVDKVTGAATTYDLKSDALRGRAVDR